MAKKRNHVGFRDFKTPMQVAMERRNSSFDFPIRASDVIPVVLIPSSGPSIEVRGYCMSSGQGNIRLIGYAPRERVWQYKGPIDDVAIQDDIAFIDNARLYERSDAPYRPIANELGRTSLKR